MSKLLTDVDVKKQVKKYLKKHADVWINKNTETGELLYSVQVLGTDFWLDSFHTLKEADVYCRKHKLPVIT